MKKVVLATLVLCGTLCSCSGDITSEESVVTTPKVNIVTTTPTIESQEDFLSTDIEVYIPTLPDTMWEDIEVNLSDDIDLSKVNINGVETDISDITLQELLDNTRMEQCNGSTYVNFHNFTFRSGMFQSVDIQEAFSGTTISVEVCDNSGYVITHNDLDPSNFAEYNVIGVSSSEFFTKDDFKVISYGGISVGMPKEEVYEVLTTPEQRIDKYDVFATDEQIMLIEYEDGAVDTVYLINRGYDMIVY